MVELKHITVEGGNTSKVLGKYLKKKTRKC